MAGVKPRGCLELKGLHVETADTFIDIFTKFSVRTMCSRGDVYHFDIDADEILQCLCGKESTQSGVDPIHDLHLKTVDEWVAALKQHAAIADTINATRAAKLKRH